MIADSFFTRSSDDTYLIAFSNSSAVINHHLSKGTVKTKAFLLNFLFIRESWKNVSHFNIKILSSITASKIDNKCFSSSKSAYYNDF